MVATVYGGCDSRDSEPKAFRMVIEVVVALIGGLRSPKGDKQRKLGKVAIGRSDSWTSNLCTKRQWLRCNCVHRLVRMVRLASGMVTVGDKIDGGLTIEWMMKVGKTQQGMLRTPRSTRKGWPGSHLPARPICTNQRPPGRPPQTQLRRVVSVLARISLNQPVRLN